jgi:hypothetical protein
MSPLSAARWVTIALCGLAITFTADSRAAELDPKHPAASYAVGEALQREIFAQENDRQTLLAGALDQAPEYAPARWHLGYFKDERRGWLKYDQYAAISKVANVLARYERERNAAADTAAGQLALADWCAENKLIDQERAHLNRVIDLAPDHAAARQRLGFVRSVSDGDGREWVSRQEIASEEAREQAGKAALAKWQPILQNLREGLEHGSQPRREFAARKLAEIRDPEAIAAIEQVFRGAADDVVEPALTTLGAMSAPEASLALARFAVYWPTPRGRELAASQLADRERDTYVPQLLASMFSPVISRFVATNLPNGRIGYRHAFVREGDDERQVMLLDTEYRRIARAGGNGRATAAQAFNDAALTARQREQAAAAQNRFTKALNQRLAWVLATATGVNLPAEPEAWWTWWNEQNEVFVQGSKQVELVHRTNQVALSDPIPTGGGQQTCDCLAAGTPVWTAKGPVAIDQIKIGDLVLAQHPDTGELAYKPVLRMTIRPQGKLLKVTAGGEEFQTSGGHLFWVAGEGWKKSRDLHSGHVLHTVRGPLHVGSVEPGSEAQTYNLVVADFSTYFVGQSLILSHDNTVRTPTRSLVPGLAAQ